MNEKQHDYKMIIGMTLLIIVLVLLAGGFWITVSKQAAEDKKARQEEEKNAISAIYIRTSDPLLGMQVFVDTNNETIFTAPVPPEGIYDQNDKLLRETALSNGDLVKIYGNGIMTMSFPGQYNGVTKIKITGRASEEETEKYIRLVESSLQGSQADPEISE